MSTQTIEATLEPLAQELAHWQSLGLRCRFWWRDDDLIAVTPALHRMLAIAERHVVTVLVAVIPQPMADGLARETMGMHSFMWCQHGYAHVNHSADDGAKSEFSTARADAEIVADLARGRALLLDRFGQRLLPILVPPWNDFRQDMVPELQRLGLTAISQYGQIEASQIGPAWRVDSHLDVVDWRDASRCTPAHAAQLTARLVEGLQARRASPAAAAQCLGLLTHHRVMGDDAWAYVDALLRLSQQFPCVDWLPPHVVFQPALQ